jgi:predicted amidohydrolase YtcJ
MVRRIAALAALSSAAAAQAGTPKADMILTNAVVHTMDRHRPEAQAVALRGRLIVGVGSQEEMARLAGRKTEVVDLHGATVVPGLRDSHLHLIGLGLERQRLHLTGTRSYDELVGRVAGAVANLRPGEWLLGRGWHEGQWAVGPTGAVLGFPTHLALSAVTPANPVVLERGDGHALLANAKAMEMAGVNDDTPAPEGGRILRDTEGHTTGIFIDAAQALLQVPPPTPEQRRQALDLVQTEALASGLTSLTDAGADAEVVALYREYASAKKLKVRLYVMAAGLETLRTWVRPEVGLGGGHLTLRAVKLYADGALGSRGAALLEPYGDDPGNLGLLVSSPEVLVEAARYALPRGFQLATHAIGDRANRLVLDAYEKAFGSFPGVVGPRFRIEHAQVLDAQEIPRFARLGVIASMQTCHAPSDRAWAEARLGAERLAEGAYAWRSLLDAGAVIANGTDAPVEDLSPIANFHAAVTRQDPHGQPPGGYDAAQRMTRAEALRSLTLDSAFAAFEEDKLGSIAVGKLADLTVLSQDLLRVPDDEILGTTVVATIVDGKPVYLAPGSPFRAPAQP